MSSTTLSLLLNGAQASQAGRKDSNEDAVALRLPTDSLLRSKGAVAAIADGVSGAEAARQAAEACVLGFISDYYATPALWAVPRAAQRVLEALNLWLSGAAKVSGGHLCTLSVLVLRSCTAHIFQVGDSRVWRLRHNRLECLTTDHSRQVGSKKYLTRAMGLGPRLEVDYRKDSMNVGDRYLLTTDGIHEALSTARIQGILRGGDSLEVICQTLIDSALENGADDNLSCQIIDVLDLPKAGAADTLNSVAALPFTPSLSPGMQIDGLQVVHELHASNRSHLYLVKHIETGEQLVLKAPSVSLLDDHEAIERFALESWVGARVRHTNIIGIKYPERPRSCMYYLMEYVEGITLEKWHTLHPDSPIQEALGLIDQLLNGLRALHRADVLHADIKPGNVIVGADGTVKIIDFGSCLPRGLLDETVNVPATPLGVRQYTAPELIAGKSPTEQSDLFSVAVMIFELITAQYPAISAASDTVPALRQFNRYAPSWLQGILDRALSFKPEERFADAAEFRAALTGRDNYDWEAPAQGFYPQRWKWLSVVLFVLLIISHAARSLIN